MISRQDTHYKNIILGKDIFLVKYETGLIQKKHTVLIVCCFTYCFLEHCEHIMVIKQTPIVV